MSANEVEFLGLEYAAKLTNKMGGNSDEVGSLMEKHWLGKNYKLKLIQVLCSLLFDDYTFKATSKYVT